MSEPKLEWFDSPTLDGPTAALESSGTGFVTLQYPRDLGSQRKSHTIRFDIKEIKHTPVSEIGNSVNQVYEKISNGIGSFFGDAASAYASDGSAGAVSSILQGLNNSTNTPFSFPSPKEENRGYVELYIPNELNFSFNAEYGGTSLASIIDNSVEKLSGGAVRGLTSIAQGDTSRLLLSRFGYAFNPQQQMLFQGINFRSYSLSFTFTPNSAAEALQVKSIIKTFRKYAAPAVIEGSAGFFYEPPAVFDIKFLFDGRENESINKVKRSVLENIEVNYAPQGWSAFGDGNPVQTTMTLSFKEIVLLDRKQISESW